MDEQGFSKGDNSKGESMNDDALSFLAGLVVGGVMGIAFGAAFCSNEWQHAAVREGFGNYDKNTNFAWKKQPTAEEKTK